MNEENGKTPAGGPDANQLAVDRTVMAAERTLMAWTRTSISLISFGFTIYKFLEYMQSEGKTVGMKDPQGPRNFGMALIAVGVFALLVASVQYRQVQKKLQPGRKVVFSLAFLTAWAVLFIGFMALANIVLQMGPF